MEINLTAKALPIQQKAFAFTSTMTVREYIDSRPNHRQLMQTRTTEVRLPTTVQEFLITYPDILNFLLIVSDDAPETAIVLPIIQRIVAASARFVLHIVRDTDDLSLLETLIDDLDISDESDTDLPLLLIFDEEWNWREQWGPRPEAAETSFDNWLEAHPEFEQLADGETAEAQAAYLLLTAELLQEMRVWYNSGLDNECINEIVSLLETLTDDDSGEDGDDTDDNEDGDSEDGDNEDDGDDE